MKDKYPRLLDALLIGLDQETILKVSVSPMREKLILRKERASRYYLERSWDLHANPRTIATHNYDQEIDKIVTVEDYIEKIQRVLDAVGKPRLKDPRMFLSDSVKVAHCTVVDMGSKDHTGYRDRKTGVKLTWSKDEDENNIEVSYSQLESSKDTPYPYKHLYIGNGGTQGTPYQFIYPTLKNVMDEALADPYLFKDRDQLTIKVKGLHQAEDNFTVDVEKGTVVPKNRAALHKIAKEEALKI
jgi:hypothetical protein